MFWLKCSTGSSLKRLSESYDRLEQKIDQLMIVLQEQQNMMQELLEVTRSVDQTGYKTMKRLEKSEHVPIKLNEMHLLQEDTVLKLTHLIQIIPILIPKTKAKKEPHFVESDPQPVQTRPLTPLPDSDVKNTI